MSFQMSSLSTEYVIIPVSARVQGILENPTGDTVQFAFKAEGADPVPADWVTGSWASTTPLNNYYQAQILVGPGTGGTVLAIGTYVIWLKITDNPEIPVRQPGTITIIP